MMRYSINAIATVIIAITIACVVHGQDAVSQSEEPNRVIERDGTRVTFLGLSKGFAFLDGDDLHQAGSKQIRYVQACFLIEGKAGVRTFEVSGPNGRIEFSGSTSQAIQADVGKKEWKQYRVEKISDSTDDKSVIFQETIWNVKSVPTSITVSLKLGEKLFVFRDVQP